MQRGNRRGIQNLRVRVLKNCRAPNCPFQAYTNVAIRDHEEMEHLCSDCSTLCENRRDHNCPTPGARRAHLGPLDIELGQFIEEESAHRGVLKLYSYEPSNSFDQIYEFYDFIETNLFNLCLQLVNHFGGVRIQLFLHVHLINLLNDDETTTILAGESQTVPTQPRLEGAIVANIIHQINILNIFVQRGSMWNLFRILKLDVQIAQYTPLEVGSTIKRPAALRNRRGLIILKSPENKCFEYAVCCARFYKDLPKRDRDKATKYEQFLHRFDFSGLSTPVKMNEIHIFEVMNQVTVNVQGLYNGKEVPIYASKFNFSIWLDLIVISNRTAKIAHFATITNFSSFMSIYNGCKSVRFYCRSCHNKFTSSLSYENHRGRCLLVSPKVVKFMNPAKPYQCFDRFKSFGSTLPMSYFGVFDFEAFVKPYTHPNASTLYSTKTHIHEPSSFRIIVKGPDNKIFRNFLYEGEGAVSKFFEKALEFADDVLQQLKTENEIIMSSSEEEEFNKATKCSLCLKNFDEIRSKVRHHHHHVYLNQHDPSKYSKIPKNYISALCNWCNLQAKEKKYLTLCAHNGSRYDWRILIRYCDKEMTKQMKVLSKNKETFYQIIIGGKLRLIDSLRHLSSSLDQLVKDLRSDGLSSFIITKQMFSQYNPKQLDILLQKQRFPYKFMVSRECFNLDKIPARSYFFDEKTNQPISDEDYQQCLTIFKFTKCKNMLDYSNLYLTLDVCLLCDVLISYSQSGHRYFGLDPLNFCSLPSFAYASMRYATRAINIQYCLSSDQMLQTLTSIRGGLQLLVRRLMRSNIPDTPTYDPSKPMSEINCLDANQLYATILTQPMPTHGYRDLTPEELDDIYQNGHIDLSKYQGNFGCFLSVNLRCPDDPKWRETYKDLPFAPSKGVVHRDELSDVQVNSVIDITENLDYVEPSIEGYLKQNRLMLTYYPKLDYCLHGAELLFYVSKGMIVDKINSGFCYHQSTFMSTFVHSTILQRQRTSKETEKKAIKLLLNSLFGKFITNVFIFKNTVISRTSRKAKQLSSSHAYDTHYPVSESLSIFSMKRPRITFKSHFLLGSKVLALSKVHMYDLYYNYLHSYLEKRVSLLYMDTDSLIIHILYQEGETSLKKDYDVLRSILDCSNKDPRDILYDNSNREVGGLLKDELKSKKCLAFCSYTMKKYFMLLYCPYTKQYGKKYASGGTSRYHMDNVSFEKYVDGLYHNSAERVDEFRIKSHHQELFSVHLRKVFRSNLYLHRRLEEDSVTTLPWGYK